MYSFFQLIKSQILKNINVLRLEYAIFLLN